MEKKILFLFMGLIILSLYNCSSGNDGLPEEQEEEKTNPYLSDNKWIYQAMNHYYYWRGDLPDSLKCDYTQRPENFYKSLLSPKDRFSYYDWNDKYKSPTSRLAPQNRGFAYQPYMAPDGKEYWQVLYVQSLHLRAKGLQRGDWLAPLSQLDSFARGCWKDGTFHIETPLTAPIQESRAIHTGGYVYLDSIYHIDGKNIGYMCYLQYGERAELESVMERFYKHKIDELILDLRYNPGGLVLTEKYLANCIVKELGYEKMFQEMRYNSVVEKERVASGLAPTNQEFFEQPTNTSEGVLGTQIYGLNLPRVYALVTGHSASASEGTLLSLMPYMDVCLIGEKTVGKGVGMFTLSDPVCRYNLVPITFRYFNADGNTVPDDGLDVDYEVPDGYETMRSELGDIQEPLLAKAIELITGKNTRSSVSGDNNIPLLKPIGEPSFVEEFNYKNR